LCLRLFPQNCTDPYSSLLFHLFLTQV